MILCSPSCGIAPNSNSGGEVLERELVIAMKARGDDPHILLARDKPAPVGLTIERLRWPRGLRWPIMPWIMAPAIRQCYRRHDVAALRAHSALYLGPACYRAARALGTTYTAHIQHLDRPHPVEGWAARKAARVVTISGFSRQQIIAAYGVRPERVEVVPPGVDHTVFYPGRPHRPTGKILFVGGLKARKRPLMLLDVLRRVEGAQLVVVGSGPMLGEFWRYAESMPYSVTARIQIYTGIPDDRRAKFYRDADVLLFPSAMEGFGMPVLEAMACGLPVVSSRAGALPELVPEAWTADDADGMADRVRRLLHDEDTAREVGTMNLKRSLDYSWDRCARSVTRVCLEASA